MRGIMADAQEVQFFFLFLNFDMVVVTGLEINFFVREPAGD